MSVDPALRTTGDPYEYANSSPIIGTDPSGNMTLVEVGIVVGGLATISLSFSGCASAPGGRGGVTTGVFQGDFGSFQEAAKAAGAQAFRKTVSHSIEYGVFIFKYKCRYFFSSSLTPGAASFVRPGPALDEMIRGWRLAGIRGVPNSPDGPVLSGFAHSHPEEAVPGLSRCDVKMSDDFAALSSPQPYNGEVFDIRWEGILGYGLSDQRLETSWCSPGLPGCPLRVVEGRCGP